MTGLETKNGGRATGSSGFTLIEALVLLFVFGVVAVSSYQAFAVATRSIVEVRSRIGATALAGAKMEIVRNLDYESIGTKKRTASGYSYGIPPGEILEDEDVTASGRAYRVHTFVQYVDDALDGKASGTTPKDGIPNDYKRVRIEVSWGAGGDGQSVALVSAFAPSGMERNEGGGVLSLNVLDHAGAAVGRATVRIVNASTGTDLTAETDATGNLTLPGAPAANQSYSISVSKDGYFPVSTLPPYPAIAFHPVDVHGSVVAGTLNQKTIVTDRSADLTVLTKDPFGNDVPDLAFRLEGGRRTGDTATVPSKPVYAVSQDFDSGSDARKTLDAQSAGNYAFTLPSGSDFRLLRLSTDEASLGGFSLLPGASLELVATVADTGVRSVLASVSDQGGAPLQNAVVRLRNEALAYDATVQTDRYGQAYFPTALPGLAAGTYELSVSASGYAAKTDTVTVSDGLLAKQLVLNP
jgi:type II secretory pathway pseudopilin PulG